MPRIAEEVFYNGAEIKVERLGLAGLLEEIRKIVTEFPLLVLEQRNANGAAILRQMLDEQFRKYGGWTKTTTGDIDWRKCSRINGTQVCVGVEVQVSGRSDLLVMDVVHLRNAISGGQIDLGVLVVPSDALSKYLTDRTPCLSDARRHVKDSRSEDYPILLIGIEHDGAGPALKKQAKKPSGT